jgi:hypothetical protein
MTFLRELAESLRCDQFLYFGDLDRRGLGIAHELDQAMRKVGVTILPSVELYRWALDVASTDAGVPIDVPRSYLSWLPDALAARVEQHLRTHGRIAQEALGWQRLCEVFGADPKGEFSLGFVPR